jgi:serine/threonine-protein kinase
MPRLLPEKLLSALRPDSTTPLDPAGDVLKESRRRILVGAAIGATAYTAFFAFEGFGVPGARSPDRLVDLTHDGIGFALCATLGILAWRTKSGHRLLFGAALATEILLCSLISVALPWAAFLRTGHVQSMTWVVPIVILFPLLVPAPPRTTLAVSVICALTMPLGVWALNRAGVIEAGLSDMWANLLTGAVAAAIANVAANTVHAAHRQTAAARRAGSYELLECLARGGMGEVWKARHAMLARPAAVKLILAEKLSAPAEARDALTARFTREAQITAGLRSPHTVELFDFGVSADGRFYFAMELLDGMNAEQWIYRFGPVEPRRAVHWLGQVCHSLSEAHGHGLVHRDIKPANLLICRYGPDVDFIKVLDFGLAKPVAPDVPGLTREGARPGTPGYMAPERIYGLDGDSRGDIYALGCVGYWLIAGRKPFESESAAELMRQHAEAAPPPLGSIARQAVPAALEAVLASCLEKRPEARPASARVLGAALAESLGQAAWTEAEAEEWWKREWPPEPVVGPGGRFSQAETAL